MSQQIECYHAGKREYLSQAYQDALANSKLKLDSPFGVVCDALCPISKALFKGQNIGCVGPNDSHCPDPSYGKIVNQE